MPKKCRVAVMDIGSKKISAYIVEGSFDIGISTVIGAYECEYSGYIDGEFVAPAEVRACFGKIIGKISREDNSIKKLYVGVPAQFCLTRYVNAFSTASETHRVTQAEIDNLICEFNPFIDSDYLMLHHDVVNYEIDSSKHIADPINHSSSTLKASIAYIGVEKRAISFIKSELARLGVHNVEYMQAEHLANKNLFSYADREIGVLSVDVGYMSTAAMFTLCDGLVELKTFSLGGELIISGLVNTFDIEVEAATALAEKVNLALLDNSPPYQIYYGGDTIPFSVKSVNDVVKECVICLAGYVKKAIDSFSFSFPPSIVLYVMGGGISEIRGAKELFARFVGRKVEVVAPELLNYSKPCFSSAVGLMNGALIEEKKRMRRRFWQR